MRTAIRLFALVVTVVVIAWVLRNGRATADEARGENAPAAAAGSVDARDPQESLPPAADDAAARLAASPRHAEWTMIRAGEDSIRSWVVYPERSDAAPVVVVIHEIFGMSTWIRAVADQLAADGFIAIAPDLLTMMDVPANESGDVADPDVARTAIRSLDREVASGYVSAVAEWGMNLPAARQAYGVVGFCWGGATSFEHAVHAPDLGAAVVYYGTSPEGDRYGSIQAPVLGLYGGNDERVNATIPAAESAMQALGKSYEPHVFPGAGHGFLRQQTGQDGANMTATEQAWPLTVAFFRQHLSE